MPDEHVADDARLLDQIVQIDAGALLAGGELEHRVLQAGGDQVILQRALVLEVLLGLAAGDFVERRLRDVEVAAVDQLAASAGRRTSAAACGCGRRRRRRPS